MDKLGHVLSSFNELVESDVIRMVECGDCCYIKNINNGKLYKISRLIYDCINKTQCPYKDLIQEEIDLLADCLESLHKTILEGGNSSRSKYIHASIILFSQESVCKLSTPFLFLFKKSFFVWFGPIVLLASVLFSLIIGLNSIKLSAWMDIVCVYVLLILSLLIHEFGHATASLHYGIKPKGIGFGLYFVFPVLYTNVSDIWFLESSKRIIVNFAGIYFQLIVNLFFIIVYIIGCCDAFVKAITMNNLICIYALLPFFRNDGYWIYSDYFKRNNLMKNDKFYILRIGSVDKIDYVSLFFSVGNTLFLCYVIYLYIIIGNGIIDDLRLYFQSGTQDLSNVLLMFFKTSCYLVFLFLYIRSQAIQIIRHKRNASKV